MSAAEPPEFRSDGLDQVEIRFTANPGEPPRPLRRIASGGELSRVMLGLKAALEAQDRVDVLLFDEVDSGIGGAVARAVGESLRRLAQHRQVVCVTHLPMIAALAAHHLRVTKHVAGGRTRVRIETLEEEARVDEVARMLAGDLATDTTRRQARELLGAHPQATEGLPAGTRPAAEGSPSGGARQATRGSPAGTRRTTDGSRTQTRLRPLAR